MLCIDKFQKLLALHLDIDPASLPNIHDVFKTHGYIGVQKGEEIEYFSKGLEEFGTNYPQYYHNGAGAITHLLETQEGQVAGAFYRKELGDIDLVWGDSSMGLAHILERRTQDFIKEGLSKEQAEIKAREFVEAIPQMVENGNVVKDDKGRLRIEFANFIVGIKDNWKGKPTNKWIVTSYAKKEGGESLYASSPITKGETLPLNSKTDFTTNTPDLQSIPQDLQEAWIKEFNLKSIDDEFIPNFKPEVKEALERAGVTEDIKLGKGSFYKLIERDRLEFLPYIRETLENSDIVIKDKENAIIFAKDIGHTSYFTSVAKDDNGQWIISTNSYKTINQLKNRVNDNGELLYLSKEAPDILAEAFTAKTFPSELNSNSTTKNKKNLQDTIMQEREQKLKELVNKSIDPITVKYKESDTTCKLIFDILNTPIKDLQNNAKFFKKLDKIINTQKHHAHPQVAHELSKFIEAIDIAYNIPPKLQMKNIILKMMDDDRFRFKYNYDVKNKIYTDILKRFSVELRNDRYFIGFGFDSLAEEARNNMLNLKMGTEEFITSKRGNLEKLLGIYPVKEFGTNYAEYYRDGQGAITKILNEAKDYEARKEAGKLTESELAQGQYKGQVAGAFHKEGLGDIDLVWGNENLGLQKIIEKHLSKGDFKAWGEGEEALIKGLSDIVENGELLTQNNVNTIILHKDNNTYRLGISKGWFDKGENNWIITAYKVDKSPRPDSLPSNEVTKSDGTNLHSNDLQPNSTTNLPIVLNKHRPKLNNDDTNMLPSNVGTALNAFADRFLNDASVATQKKFENLKLGNFMQDFDNVRGIEALGIIENTPIHTINGYIAHLENGNKVHIKTYTPIGEGKEVRGFKKTYHYKERRAKLTLSDANNTPLKSLDLSIQEITPHGFNQKTTIEYSITINDGQKAKTLQTNTHNTGRQTSKLNINKDSTINNENVLDTKLLGNNEKYKEAKEYEILQKEGYKGFKIDIKQNIEEINPYKVEHHLTYTATKDKQNFSAPTLQDLKAIIDYSQKEISKEESKVLSNFAKDLNIKVFGKIKQSKLNSYGHLSDSNYQINPIKRSKDFLEDLNKLHKFGDYAYDKLQNTYHFDKLDSKYLFEYQEELHKINKLIKEQEDNFGINFIIENHSDNLTKGEIALDILLNARAGQVAGAFYRKELGDIDLVWGDSSMGLAHILERRTQDFIKEGLSEAEAKAKAREFVEALPEIIEKGEVTFGKNRAFIDFDNKRGLIALDYKGDDSRKWLITAYKEYDAPTPANPHQSEHNIDTSSVNRIDGDMKANSTTTANESKVSHSNPTKIQTNPHLNPTLQEAQKIFKTYNKDEYNDKLFDKVLEVANSLDVRYWDQRNPKWISGSYTYYLNRAMVDTKLFAFNKEEIAPTLLHELIHSTTSRAIHLYDNGHKELLSKAQQEAISEIKAIYNTISEHNRALQWKAYANSKEEIDNNKGRIYGLKNEHEMLAELANKDFRDFLKEQNLFTKIINAIAKVFSYIKGGSDDVATNALKEVEKSLHKLIDNYEPNFSSEFDRVYAREGFIDLDNYKKYLSKHSAKVKEYKDDDIAVVNVKRDYFRDGKAVQVEEKARLWAQDIARGGITNRALRERAELFFAQYYGVPFQEIESNPIGKELIEQLSGKYFKGRVLPHEDFLEHTNRLEKIKALKPLFASGAYKYIDNAYAATLLDTINTILQKPNILYRKRAINGFFAREFVESEVKKLTHTQESLRLESKFLNNKGEP